VGDTANPVVFMDCMGHLATMFKPIKRITQYRQFHLSSENPGTVVCKEYSNSSPVKFVLTKPTAKDICSLPCAIPSKGMDLDRQWYLHDTIREFYRSDKSEEATCPKTPHKACKKTRLN